MQAFFFVSNAVNLSEENEKLARTICVSLNYTTTKETLKKVFSGVSSLEHKNVPVLKEVETIMPTKISYEGGNGVNFLDKQGRLKCGFKCNSAKHFVHDCTGSRNNINIVLDSVQVHFTLFNVDTHY